MLDCVQVPAAPSCAHVTARCHQRDITASATVGRVVAGRCVKLRRVPQNVHPFDFSDAAKQLRAFVYDYWCAHGHGPNLRAVHEGTGLDRRTIVQGYKELQLGIICVVDQDSQNCNVLKFQPFSSFPSQVEVWVDGAFHSFAGCALESVAISRMPAFEGKSLLLRSYCACCLAPIDLDAREGVVSPADGALVHI